VWWHGEANQEANQCDMGLFPACPPASNCSL